jgi:transposase-like protein
MPQVQLPIFPKGTTMITPDLAFESREGKVVYFNGHLPVFTHAEEDLASFRLFTSQLIINGSATQGDIMRAFGVSLTTIKRCTKRYREGGAKAFFTSAPPRRGHRLTPERLSQAQALLDRGEAVSAIGAQLGVLATTLHKAIDTGRLRQFKKKSLRLPARAG